MKRCRYAIPLSMALAALVLPAASGCGKDPEGGIKIDGSSTVYLVSEAVAAAFKKEYPGVNIAVGLSGTGGGFKKFSSGETDIQDASRAITATEKQKCAANGVTYSEIQIAWDGIAVVVNKNNHWGTQLTMAQLKKIWQPENPAKTWKDVDPAWPNEKIDLYGPGPDSGTFDYFTEEVNGTARVTRKDYNASGDPETMVQGVSRNKYRAGVLRPGLLRGVCQQAARCRHCRQQRRNHQADGGDGAVAQVPAEPATVHLH